MLDCHPAHHAQSAACSVQVLTRASLVLLLFGTIVGVLAQLSSIGLRAVYLLYDGQPPAWLVASDGRVVMLFLTLGIVTPLCCLRRRGA